MRKLIIVGLGETSCIVHECFKELPGVQVVGFAVNKAYHRVDIFQELPVYVLEDFILNHNSSDYVFFVALSGGRCNQDRAKIFNFINDILELKSINFISKFSHVASSCKIGVNNLIMEMSSLQHNVKIGSNCIVWNGVQICHSSTIGNNVYLSPSTVVCGFCKIGNNTYLGARVTVINNITIGANCFISAGLLIKKNIPDNTLVKSNGEFIFDIDLSKFNNNNFYGEK